VLWLGCVRVCAWMAGATLGQNRWLLQGLFMVPGIVGESLKGAMLLAEVFGRRLGMPCNPPPGPPRTDIIQAIQVGDRDRVVQFCKQVRSHARANPRADAAKHGTHSMLVSALPPHHQHPGAAAEPHRRLHRAHARSHARLRRRGA
jgi:hypothetical protein